MGNAVCEDEIRERRWFSLLLSFWIFFDMFELTYNEKIGLVAVETGHATFILITTPCQDLLSTCSLF